MFHSNSVSYTPTFPYKMYQMLCDTSCITFNWNEDGDGVEIDMSKFDDEILRNTAIRWKYQINWKTKRSLIRQLHAYSFHKVSGKLSKGSNSNITNSKLSYTNENFVRGKPDLLKLLKRNVSKKDSNKDDECVDDKESESSSQSSTVEEIRDTMTSNAVQKSTSSLSKESANEEFNTAKTQNENAKSLQITIDLTLPKEEKIVASKGEVVKSPLSCTADACVELDSHKNQNKEEKKRFENKKNEAGNKESSKDVLISPNIANESSKVEKVKDASLSPFRRYSKDERVSALSLTALGSLPTKTKHLIPVSSPTLVNLNRMRNFFNPFSRAFSNFKTKPMPLVEQPIDLTQDEPKKEELVETKEKPVLAQFNWQQVINSVPTGFLKSASDKPTDLNQFFQPAYILWSTSKVFCSLTNKWMKETTPTLIPIPCKTLAVLK